MPERDAIAIDWDAPGTLAIVIQGGLFESNIAETASHAAHWRNLFPQAKIVLALSTTDLLAETSAGSGQFRLAQRHRDNGPFRAALRQIQAACEAIRVSPGAVSFPPLKFDGRGLNNVNLQIAAARAGLEAVSARYVLRVRSDLVFIDRRFLAQYAEGLGLPRGTGAVLRQRVLASWLFTLNPYGAERMPLHVSDWFHLGLTEDVRRLWDVPPMSLADASHHKVHGYPPFANALERMLVPRIAVEQHLLYHAFKPAVPDLALASFLDWTSRDQSVDLLVDNFVLCDVGAAGCIFDKYSAEFTNPARLGHCVTRDDWRRMAPLAGAERRAVLIEQAEARIHPERRSFPRTWSARALSTKQGLRSAGDIVATPRGGVLIHGPYDRIPSGRYRATLHASACRGIGAVTLRATLGEGRRHLAERRVALEPDADQPLELAFDLLSGVGTDLEVVCEVEGDPLLVVTGLTIDERPDAGFSEVARFDATAKPMDRRFGETGPEGVATAGREGHLLFGPWIVLPAGSYRASFLLRDVAEPGGARVEVAAEAGPGRNPLIVAAEEVRPGDGPETHVCEFALPEQTRGVEFRIWVGRTSRLIASRIVLERR